jgi:hypothetical protein
MIPSLFFYWILSGDYLKFYNFFLNSCFHPDNSRIYWSLNIHNFSCSQITDSSVFQWCLQELSWKGIHGSYSSICCSNYTMLHTPITTITTQPGNHCWTYLPVSDIWFESKRHRLTWRRTHMSQMPVLMFLSIWQTLRVYRTWGKALVQEILLCWKQHQTWKQHTYIYTYIYRDWSCTFHNVVHNIHYTILHIYL